MPYIGHCNCESIRVILPQQPMNSKLCYCVSCQRAGGAFSVNYLVSEDELTVEDSASKLKIYHDRNTASGNVVQRHFCSSCGSPIFTRTPTAPGQVFLKAPLFDVVSPSDMEIFEEKKLAL